MTGPIFPKRLRFEILLLISLKLLALAILYQLFFAHAQQPQADTGAGIAAHLFEDAH